MLNYRTVGEFEPQESVLLIWPKYEYATKKLNNDTVSLQIVNALISEVTVFICCYDDTVQERARKKLIDSFIPLDKIKFVNFESEIPYPRDFGADMLISDDLNLIRADFRFNMYGYNHEDHPLSRKLYSFASFHSDLVGCQDVVYVDLISEGGAREYNGKGVMIGIKDTEHNKRNPEKSICEIEGLLKRSLNLKKVIWLPIGTYDDEYAFSGPIPDEHGNYTAYRSASANGHIDEMCRFVSHNKIIIAHVTEEQAKQGEIHSLNKARLDAAYDVLKNNTDIDGNQFEIYKMPMPEPIYIQIDPEDDAYELWSSAKDDMNGFLLDGSPFPSGKIKVLPAMSYCNFLICNNVIISQKYYEEGMSIDIKKRDDESLKVLKEVF
ncbi:agmatine/peptidylarginine deiminase, partial [Vibrio cholerae]